MELQEIFDKVRAHLLKQGKPALDEKTDRCMYRMDSGLACAVGCLIPPHAYDPRIEGTPVEDILSGPCAPATQALLSRILTMSVGKLTEDKLSLLFRLQKIHDDYCTLAFPLEQWNKSLNRCAEDFELKVQGENP